MTAQAHPAELDHLETFPLSFAQERLWFLEQLHPGTPQFVITTAIRVSGALDLDRLDRAVSALVDRHGVLRTRVVDRGVGPVQEMLPVAHLRLARRDLSLHPDAEASAAQAIARTVGRGFDLAAAPIMRGMVIRLSAQDWVLVLCLHHIVCDGVSIDILVRDLVALYGSDGVVAGLPELDIDYGDYAEWQRQEYDEAALGAQLDFWADELAGADPRTYLPVDGSPSHGDSRPGASVEAELSGEKGRALLAAARREGVSPFMLVLAAWQLVLVRTSGRRGVTVGTTVTGRESAQTADVFGCFLNVVALRSDLDEGMTLSELLGRVRSRCQRAFSHSDVPFEQVVERISPIREASHGPLFDAMVAVQVGRRREILVEGLRLRPEPITAQSAQYEVVLDVQLDESGVDLCLGYSTEVLSGRSATTMLGRLSCALQAFAVSGDVLLADVPLDAAPPPGVPAYAAPVIHDRRSLAVTAGSLGEPAVELGVEGTATEVARALSAHGLGAGTVVAVDAADPLVRAGRCVGAWRAGAGVLVLDHGDPVDWSRRVCRARGAGALLDAAEALVDLDDGPTSTSPIAWCSADSDVAGSLSAPLVEALVSGLGSVLGLGPIDVVLISATAHPGDVLAILLAGARPLTVSPDAIRAGALPAGVTAVWLGAQDWDQLLEQGWRAPDGVVVVGDGATFAGARDQLGPTTVLLDRSLPSGLTLVVHRTDGGVSSDTALPGVAVRVVDDLGADALSGAVGRVELVVGVTATATGDLARAGEPPELLGHPADGVVDGRVVDVEIAAAAVAAELGLDRAAVRCEVVDHALSVSGGPSPEALHRAVTTALPRRLHPAADDPAGGGARRPPSIVSDELTVAILAAFRRSLERPDLRADEDFFDAGGTSLAAARLVRELTAATGTQVPVRALFAHPTAAGLRAAVTAPAGAGAEAGALTQASRDAVLDADVRPTGRRPQDGPPRAVLLTGATGFLGAHLLAALRSATDAEITCLVRADDDRAARARLAERLNELRIDLDLTGIRCLAADLSQPDGFGMRAETLDVLGRRADVVLHSAAVANFSLPYRSLAATNVEATRQLLRLACTGTPSTFHHLSTMDAGLGGTLTETPMPLDSGSTDGYVLSKKVAETLVLQAGGRGLPVEVHRPGLITSSTRTGATASTDQFGLCLAASLAAGVLPATLPAPLHLLPVDEVADHIVRRVVAGGGDGLINHLHQHRAVRLDEVRDLLADLGHPLELVPFDRWRITVARRTAGRDTGLSALLALAGGPGGEAPRVSTEGADRRLGSDLWSDADRGYLSRTIDFLHDSGAVSAPVARGRR